MIPAPTSRAPVAVPTKKVVAKPDAKRPKASNKAVKAQSARITSRKAVLVVNDGKIGGGSAEASSASSKSLRKKKEPVPAFKAIPAVKTRFGNGHPAVLAAVRAAVAVDASTVASSSEATTAAASKSTTSSVSPTPIIAGPAGTGPQGRSMVTRRMVKAAAEASTVGEIATAAEGFDLGNLESAGIEVMKEKRARKRASDAANNTESGVVKRLKRVPTRVSKDVGALPLLSKDAENLLNQSVAIDGNHKIFWDKSPIKIMPNEPGYDTLSAEEIGACSILRLSALQYLSVKHILVETRMRKGGSFSKREAQSLCKIDVNKTSRLFDWFVAKGWLEPHASSRGGKK
ncbi:Transcriptional adapter ada2 [Dinochytrium kinnereticum]|nr:Transcriptional adapter ada2 [Dinochytrium kinnereticum]